MLQRGCCLKEYDMRAGAAKLAAAPDSGTEASSEALQRLLTIVTLRHIARNGYEPFCWGGSDFRDTTSRSRIGSRTPIGNLQRP